METKVNKETNEFILIREFNAPIQKVWDAYTKPELIAQWWGPRGFTTEVKEMDVRPGGVWFYIMHGTGEQLKGTQFENMDAPGKAFYDEVEPLKKIVYRDAFADNDGNVIENMPVGIVTMNFEEKDGKTILTSTTKYPTAEALQQVVDMGMEQGISETFDRLDELLVK